MTSRRQFLALLSAGVVSLSGCSDGGTNNDPGRSTKPSAPTDTKPSPSPSQTPDSSDGAESGTPTETLTPTNRTLDIREFGAAVDGETDDTGAVRDAIAAADPGDIVFFPKGETVVSGEDREYSDAIRLDGDSVPENLTLAGEGRESVIRMAGDQPRYHELFRLEVNSGYEGLRIRDLRLDGNKEGQSQKPGSGGHGIKSDNANSADVPVDILIRNVWLQDFNMSGISVLHGGIVIDRCTARGCVKHGIAVSTDSDVEKHDPPIAIRNCYCVNNGHEGTPVTYGIDCSGGKTVVEDTVCENNAQGTKTTSGAVDITYRRVRLKNNAVFGYIRPGGESETRGRVTFEDVVSEGNGEAGFRLTKDTDYRIPTEIVATENRKINVFIKGNAHVDAETIWATHSKNGTGLYCNSLASGTVATYHPYENAEGSTDLNGELEISDEVPKDRQDIDSVPTATEVGAGSFNVPGEVK